MRLSIAIAVLSSVLASVGSLAQDVRDERAYGANPINRAYRRAADKQHRTDWPIKSEGRPGTAVRFTFDPRNADIHIITDHTYGSDRILETARQIVRDLELPKADFIRDRDSSVSTGIDLEFNDYLNRTQSRITTFDFDLSQFAKAILKTDLPRPIIFGIRSDHSRLNTVTFETPMERRRLEGIVFLRADQVLPNSTIHWRAEVHWSGYIAFLCLIGLAMLVPLSLLLVGFRQPKKTIETSVDPDEVQNLYDKSPSSLVLMLGMPLLLVVLVLWGGVFRAMESMSFLLPSGTLMVISMSMIVLTMVSAFAMQRRLKKRITQPDLPEADPDEPPAWTRTAFLTAMLPTMFLLMVCVIVMQFWNPLRSLPMAWRRSAPIWLPLTLFIFGFLPSIMAGRKAAKVIKRQLSPGEPWFDRVMELAKRAGVPVRRVFEVWSSSPNAYASMFGDVGLTRGLLHKLNPEEIDAVIAHELGHHVDGHPRRIFFTSLTITIAIFAVWISGSWYLEQHYKLSAEARALLNSPIFFFLFAPLIRSFLQGNRVRKQELEADRFAVDVIGDSEVVIRALTRIHDLNAMPHRLKSVDEAVQAHPSLEKRIASIREYAGRQNEKCR